MHRNLQWALQQQEDGDTAIHHAARAGQKDACAVLIKFKASPHIPNAHGRTAVDLAQDACHVELAGMLERCVPHPHANSLSSVLYAKRVMISRDEALALGVKEAHFDAADWDGNGCLTVGEIFELKALSAGTGAANKKQIREIAQDVFDALHKNRDGSFEIARMLDKRGVTISFPEAKAAGLTEAAFQAADTYKRGYLGVGELLVAMAFSRLDKTSSGKVGMKEAKRAGISEAMFSEADTNDSGELSYDQFAGIRMFIAADEDGDSRLSRVEAFAAGIPEDVFKAADIGGEGHLGWKGFCDAKAYLAADSKQNGRITKQGALPFLPEDDFDAADTDGDGILDMQQFFVARALSSSGTNNGNADPFVHGREEGTMVEEANQALTNGDEESYEF